ncbi:MAG: sigma-70 family RNA polymerase sigma factor [Gammaproteobacteria bacterium]|jgi:RNA polymerase sigma-70 factor (ECF subfamily)
MADQKNKKTFFSHRIEETMNSLYVMANRLTKNNADAEDLVADAVTKAWLAIETLEDEKRFKSWIFRILHNCFVSDYRKKSVRPSESTYDENSAGDDDEQVVSYLLKQPNEFLCWWAEPEREFVNNLLGDDIMAAVEDLPEAYRVTVLLINVEGFSYDEAAEIIGVPPGTVRSRMKRGRTLLQKALWEQAKDAGLVTSDTMKERQ